MKLEDSDPQPPKELFMPALIWHTAFGGPVCPLSPVTCGLPLLTASFLHVGNAQCMLAHIVMGSFWARRLLERCQQHSSRCKNFKRLPMSRYHEDVNNCQGQV